MFIVRIMKIESIIERLGREQIARRVGVTSSAVVMARARGQFPASWFVIIRGMAAELGIDCPAALFAMKQEGERGD